MAGIPPGIKALAEMSPLEDLLLYVLRAGLPGVDVQTLISFENQTFPLVLARRSPTFGDWVGDTRFLDSGEVSVHCFAEDPNGDEDAALLSEAVRVVLRDAWLNQTVIPGRGHFTYIEMASPPRRSPDLGYATMDFCSGFSDTGQPATKRR